MRRVVSLVLLTSFLLAPSLVLAQDASTPPAEVRREVHLFLHEDVSQFMDEECGITDERAQARFFVESKSRGYSIQRTINDGGRPVDADESPINEPGCLFEFDLTFPEAPGYTFRITPTVLAMITFDVIAGMDDPLVLAMDQYGSRTPSLGAQDGMVVPTPEPTPTPTPRPPTPTPIPTPEPGKIDDDTYRIVGRFVLRSEEVVNTSSGCYGTGGYSDVSDGSQVIIRDGNNNILGAGRLEDIDLSSTFGCSYLFSIEVPKAPFYQVEFSHRSSLVYTFDEMEDMGWEVWLGLGD